MAQEPSSFAGYLLGAGNPLLDITTRVEQSILDTYGLSVDQAVIAEEKHKSLFEEISSNPEVEHVAGGATLNAIRVAQWLLQEPQATAFIGAIGKDANGTTLKECASKDGVALHLNEVDSFATGTCAVLIREKQHSLVANLAASQKYTQEHFESAEIQQVVKQAKIIYSAAYFLATSPATVHALGTHCAAENKIFALSFGAAYIAKQFAEPLLKAIEYSDFIFATETDVREFAKSQEYHADNVKDIALLIAQLPRASGSGSKRARVVVVTRGRESTVVAQQTRVVELPVPFRKEEVVDPNGVGDAFVGGFLAGLVRGLDLQERVNAGHYAAFVVSQASGCNPKGVPELDLKAVQAATAKVVSSKKSRARQSEVRTAVRELIQVASNGEEKGEEIKEEAAGNENKPEKSEKPKKDKGEKVKKDKKKSEKSEKSEKAEKPEKAEKAAKSEKVEKEAKPEKEKKAKKNKDEKRKKSEKDESKKVSSEEPETAAKEENKPEAAAEGDQAETGKAEEESTTAATEDIRADPANSPEEVPAVRVHLEGSS